MAHVAASAAKHVLVVDDDDAVMTVVVGSLRDFRISACIDADDALAVLRREPVDVLVSDYVMPKMAGDELVTRARAIRPDLPTVVMTGYVGAANASGLTDVRVLEKPFTRGELLDAIAHAIGAR